MPNINISISVELHKAIKDKANKEDVTRKEFVIRALEKSTQIGGKKR